MMSNDYSYWNPTAWECEVERIKAQPRLRFWFGVMRDLFRGGAAAVDACGRIERRRS